MQIILDWESSALSAPQSFRDTVQAAANFLDATITDNISVTIKVGYGDYNNGQNSNLTTSALGGVYYGVNTSYANLRSALASHETSSVDQSFVNSLPNTASINGVSTFFVPEPTAKALGLWTFGNGYEDGAIGIGTQIGSNVLFGVAMHELAHALGRLSGTSGSLIGPLDLAQYSSAGHINTGGTGSPGYFSIDGGVTKIADFSSDPGDFLNTGVQGPNDPFNEFYSSSTIQTLTTVDKELLDVMGFNVTPTLSYDPSVILADFNGDHKIDVLQLTGSGMDAFVHLSTGTSFAARSFWGTGFTSSDKAIDLNGDGKADMIQFYNGTNYVALSNGSGFGSWSNWGYGATSQDKLIDVNGDGKNDIVQYYHGREIVALSTGTKFGAWTDWGSGATSSDKVVDVNGDHKADLLQVYHDSVYVALSNGSGFGAWTHWASGGTINDQLIDVNADGKADLVQYYSGREYVALSSGTNFGSWTQWATGTTSNDHLVDVNGDGRADLVQYYIGREYVALSNGSSFGSWTQWASGATVSDHLVDLNGDGKADLLQYYQGSAYAALSNGSSFGPWQAWGSPSATDQSAAPGSDPSSLDGSLAAAQKFANDAFSFNTTSPTPISVDWHASVGETPGSSGVADAVVNTAHFVLTVDSAANAAPDLHDKAGILHSPDFLFA